MDEALGRAGESPACTSTRLRVRAFPSTRPRPKPSSPPHETVFVVEQNRDAQLRTLLVNELEIDPARLVPVLHYDGTPITARFIVLAPSARLDPGELNVLPPSPAKAA